jgi:hypothetical protein
MIEPLPRSIMQDRLDGDIAHRPLLPFQNYYAKAGIGLKTIRDPSARAPHWKVQKFWACIGTAADVRQVTSYTHIR